jgi:hypothetical protein
MLSALQIVDLMLSIFMIRASKSASTVSDRQGFKRIIGVGAEWENSKTKLIDRMT